MSGLGATGFSGAGAGAGAFVTGVCVNSMELSCSCKRAAWCFNSSVVGSADGIVGTAFGVFVAGDVVSAFDEMPVAVVTGGFGAT
jgi:hypothetical protein